MTGAARDGFLEQLEAGNVSAVPGLMFNGRRALGLTTTTIFGSKIEIDARAIETLAIGDLAYVLGHELGHANAGRFSWGNREADAEAFACAKTWGRERALAGFYRPTLGPCGSGVP